MTETLSTQRPRPPPAGCTAEARITRSLLGYGVIAGPFYIVVSLAQALARDGFDLTPARVEPARQRPRRLDPGAQPRR